MIPDGFPTVVRYVFMTFHDSSIIFLEFSHFPMMVLWFSYELHNFSRISLCILWFCYRVAMLSFEYDMIWLRCSYGFPFVFLSVPMVFLWSSFGSPMVFIWFCWVFRWNSLVFFHGFPMVFLGVPIVLLWFAKDPEAHGD